MAGIENSYGFQMAEAGGRGVCSETVTVACQYPQVLAVNTR